jgi:hypothetical protein
MVGHEPRSILSLYIYIPWVWNSYSITESAHRFMHRASPPPLVFLLVFPPVRPHPCYRFGPPIVGPTKPAAVKSVSRAAVPRRRRRRPRPRPRPVPRFATAAAHSLPTWRAAVPHRRCRRPRPRPVPRSATAAGHSPPTWRPRRQFVRYQPACLDCRRICGIGARRRQPAGSYPSLAAALVMTKNRI